MKRFVVLFILFAVSLFVFAQENLVLNGDFEEIYEDTPLHWASDGWQKSPSVTRYYSSSDNPHSGDYFAVIENISENDARFYQTVKVEPDTVYKLSCWIRVKVVETDRTGANITIFDNSFMQHSRSLQDTQGNWEYVEFRVRTDSDQKRMDVCFRLGAFGNTVTGKADFDDFRLEKVDDPGVAFVASLGTGANAADTGASGFSILVTVFLVLLAFALIGFVFFAVFSRVKSSGGSKKTRTGDKEPGPGSGEKDLLPGNGDKKVKFTKLDFLLCGILTLVYILVAYTHLGSFKAPQTHWKAAVKGESFYVDFGSPARVERFMYFEGIPNGHTKGKFTLEASLDAVNWKHMASFTPSSIFFWFESSVNTRARYVRIISDVPNVELKEMAFFPRDSYEPLEIKNIVYQSGSILSEGEPAFVFDEADTIPRRPTMMNGMPTSFDELYHARTAYEHLHKIYPYETTHPPLGKIIIALGIQIFGMVPFGWRFMGTTFGVLMVILMYLFGKRLFKKSEFALMCAFLMAVDFMHFLHTRIATIDSYAVFFVILMYYFIYQYYSMDFYKKKFSETLRPLFFCGLFWGIGIACKWNCLFAGFGLAFIFFLTIGKRIFIYNYYNLKLSSKKAMISRAEREELVYFQKRFILDISLTIAWCVLVFIILPVIIYLISYVPYMMTLRRVDESRSMWDPRNLALIFDSRNLKAVWREQQGMWNYHSSMDQGHPSSSRWWEWPLMLVNMTYHVGTKLPQGKTETVMSIGNPAVWWVGTMAVLTTIGLSLVSFIRRLQSVASKVGNQSRSAVIVFYNYMKSITQGERTGFFIGVAFLSQYLPWVLSPRQLTFIYHFFPSVPFIILAIVYLIREWLGAMEKRGARALLLGRVAVYTYLVAALVLFIMFYPVIAGQIVDRDYVQNFLHWIPSWRIY